LCCGCSSCTEESVTSRTGERQHPFETGQGVRQGAGLGKLLVFTGHRGKKEDNLLLLQMKVQTHKTAARLFNGIVLHTWELPELS